MHKMDAHAVTLTCSCNRMRSSEPKLSVTEKGYAGIQSAAVL